MFVDDHLPQPDVQGWRQRQHAALWEAEGVARHTLGAVLAEGQPPPPAQVFAAACLRSSWHGSSGGAPGLSRVWQAVVSLHSAPDTLPPHCQLCLLQVSPAEEFTSPPLPQDEWQATYRGSMQHTEATVGSAVEHAAGPLQVCSS